MNLFRMLSVILSDSEESVTLVVLFVSIDGEICDKVH